MAYDCFISYSHQSDGKVAPALEHGLKHLARPWYRLRALHVFRDQSNLPLTPRLWSTIAGALDDSRFFVLLASPESAASEWVNREVAYWCETKGKDRLLPVLVLTGGDIAWDQEAGDFSAASTAIPAALRGWFEEEPLYLDLSWAREEPDLSWRLSLFRGAIAKVASPMHCVPPEELESEDVRLHLRARRLAKAAVSGLVVLALIASAAAVVAVANARRATREARVALARQVGLEAIDLPASALDRAFLLSLASADLETGADAAQFRPARTLIGRFSRLDRIRSTETPSGSTSVRSVALAADGTLAGSVLTFDAGGGSTTKEVLVWPAGAGSPRRFPSQSVGDIAFVGATSDHLVLRNGDDGLRVTPDGEVHTLPGRVAALRGDVARALMVDAGTARLVDLADGRVVAELPIDGAVVTAAVHEQVTVLATASRLVLLDSRSGAVTGDVALPAPVVGAEANEDGSAVATIEQGESSAAALRVWRRQPDGSLGAGDAVAVDLGSDAVRRVVVAPDGGRVLVVTDKRTLLVPTAGGRPGPIGDVVVDEGGIGLVEVDRSGRFAAVGGPRLAVWDLQTGQRPIALPEWVSAMAWGGSCLPGEPCVLTTVGKALDVLDPVALTHQRMATETNAQAVAVAQDGSTLTSAGWGQSVAVWQLRSRPDATVRREVAPAGALTAFDAASGVLARVEGGTAVLSGPGRAGRPRSIPVGEAERIILLAGAERLLTVSPGAVRLWDTDSAEAVPLDRKCGGDLLATSPDGAVVASLRRAENLLALCDAGSGGWRVSGRLDLTAPSALAVGDDGTVVVGTEDSALARYPLVNGRFQDGISIDVGFGGERVRVNTLAVAGGRLAAGLTPVGQGAQPGRVLVWDVGGKGEPIVFGVDQREVAAVALPGDGELLVVAGRDHDDGPVTVQVWESATRRRMGRALDGLSGAVTQLTGDEEGIVGVDRSGHAVLWLLGRDPRQEVCEIVGRPLRADEWAAAASGVLGREEFSAQCP